MRISRIAALAAIPLSSSIAQVVPRQNTGGVQPVTTRGNAFYRGDERFYIRGVAYQPGKLIATVIP